ncbi:MAG: hypothetical protein MJE77_09465 [Proteobacteria bacterium]|nr:hypothetical protein [Pseudomonadota bacterium]
MSGPFELNSGFFPGELASMALGPWSNVSRSESGLVSFSSAADEDATVEAPHWCVDLDGDLSQALAMLEAGDRSLLDTETRLVQISDRFDRTIEIARTSEAGQVSFSSEVLPDSESRLLDDWNDAFAPARHGEATENIPRAAAKSRWSEMAASARSAIEAVWRLVSQHSWVDTRLRGRLVASTFMTVSGDTRLTVGPQLTAETAFLHRRSFSLAVRTRDAWARLLTSVLQISARIARVAAVPHSFVTALPIVWKFARNVLAEIDTLRQLSRQHQT